MRSLPGRAARANSTVAPVELTRDTVADEQRRRIRRATGELVAKRGYAGVGVELIIKRAHVSFKTFYKLYANKEEALIDLFDVSLEATRQGVARRIEAAEAAWPEQVAIVIRTFFEGISAEPLLARACLVEAPTAGPELLYRYERVAQAFVSIFRGGRELSATAAELPESLEDTLAGSVLWAAYQRLNFSEVDRIEELIPENVELVLRPYIGQTKAAKVAGRSLRKSAT